MDILSAKQKVFTDAPGEAVKDRSVTLGDFTINFGDLLSRAGLSKDNDANALASFSGIGKVAERVERPAPPEKQTYEQDYERNDDAPRAERYENSDSGREQYVERKDDPGNGGGDPSSKTDDAPVDNKADNDSAAAGADDDAPSGETQKADNKPAQQEQSSGGETSKQNDDSGAETDVADKDKGSSGNQHSEEVLSSLLAAAAGSASVSQVAEQASNHGAENAEGKNGAEGLAKALAAVSGEKSSKGDNSALGAQNQKSLAQTHGQGQKQQAPQEQIQSQNQAKGSAANAASQQAAGIAKLAGDGARININVNTTEGAASVVSKPSSTLSAATILSADASAQQPKGPQPTLNHGAANPNAAAAQGAPAQNQAQQVSAQIATATGGEAKGPIQTVQTANAGAQQAPTAGVDGALNSGPSSLGDTSQTLKNAAAQANNAQHANQAKQAVLNQVTVQISKAIKAGLDRITIQLRPENLGRVEVRLDIGQDGRTQAVVIADNKETLELLQRDAKELTRALQDAGLDLANEDLNFGLREQNAEGDGKEGSNGSSSMDGMEEDDEALPGDALAAAYDGDIIEDGHIDIRA